MVDVIEIADTDKVDLAEFVALFNDMPLEHNSEESLAATAPLLKKLANDKVFLSKFLLDELNSDSSGQESSQYTAQVFMIKRLQKNYHIRANIWPATHDPMMRSAKDELFAYAVPHDHSFSFLTVGYWGPGYSSEYYEYEEDPEGYPGEPVQLRYMGDKTLGEGRLMLYRAHKDIHAQRPPSELSVTLNIMDGAPDTMFRHQLIFDPTKTAVQKVMHPQAAPSTFELAVAICGDRAVDSLMKIYNSGLDDMIRFQALRAAGMATGSVEGLEAVVSAGIANPSDRISGWCRAYFAEFERQGATLVAS